MSNRKIKILLVSSVVLGLLMGGVIFAWKDRAFKKTNQEKEIKDRSGGKNEPVPNQPSETKKNLAREIKKNIFAELKAIKEAKTTNEVDEILVFGYKIGRDGAILRNNDQKKVLPAELEASDYQEIVNLISQEKKELARNKTSELRKEVSEKLTNQPNLFYWPVQISKTPKMSDWYAWSLSGKEKGQDYRLIIPRDHPAVFLNFFEDCQFYRINGVENIPLTPSDGEQPYKIVKLSDQITIRHYKT